MSDWVDYLNLWGAQLAGYALPMLWQSSLFILIVFALDWLLRRRLRPAVRYGLWTLVLMKLVLPPSFALPTSLAWWVRSPARSTKIADPAKYVVTYGPMQPAPLVPVPTNPATASRTASPLSLTTIIAFGAIGISFGLFGAMVSRSRQVRHRLQRTSEPQPDLQELFAAARAQAGLKRRVRLELTSANTSPAVYGLFRPVILLPRDLIDQLDSSQLRAVLLHESFHIKRGDAWIHCVQSLLQILFWWHPLLWLANARMRQLREQAVDDAVMLALRSEAESYVPALFKVATMVVNRPATALGLISILESRTDLQQRIERLLDFHAPRIAGMTVFSFLGLFTIAAVALPMGVAPSSVDDTRRAVARIDGPIQSSTPSPSASLNLQRKLESIRLEKVAFDRVPLPQVLLWLTGEAQKHDPRLIPFVAGPGTVVDPQTGLPVASGSEVDLSPIRITLNPALENIRLLDVLDAIVKVADKPIRYSLKNDRVVFEPRGVGESEILYVRFFPITYATFVLNLRNWLGLTDSLDVRDLHKAFLEKLYLAGIDLQPPKSMFWSISNGLVVRATSNELFQVQSILRQIDEQPAMPGAGGFAYLLPASGSTNIKVDVSTPSYVPFDGTQIKSVSGAASATGSTKEQALVRIFKVDPNTFLENLRRDSKPEWSVDRSLREFLSRNVQLSGFRAIAYDARVGSVIVTATAANMEAIEAAVETLTFSPPQVHIQAWIIELESRDPKALGFGWEWQALNVVTQHTTGHWTAILSDPQGRVLLRALEQRTGQDIPPAPQVLTLSGRQAQIQIAESMTLIKGINADALHLPGVKESEIFLTEKLNCGPVLDVLPTVQEDGRTIDLRVTAQVTEFLGYNDSAEKIDVYVDGTPRSVKAPRPRLRVRTLPDLSMKVSDGQMLVLGNPRCLIFTYSPDGNARVEISQETNLLVLITPTIVDSAGNRVNAPK